MTLFRTWRSDYPDGVCDLSGHHEGLQCSSVCGLQTWDPGPGQVTRAPRPGEVSSFPHLNYCQAQGLLSNIRLEGCRLQGEQTLAVNGNISG